MTDEADPSAEDDAREELLKSLRDADASDERIAEAAWNRLARLLELEHPHLAAWHACQYESFWDDGRKLEILEGMNAQGMESHAIMLCHRWKLSKLCNRKKRQLYKELFPERPPRTRKGETP